ncbi:MAG: hypothetical protein HDT38_01015 [Clostridiales bacterium]|nr:hypothetical protein [Clostridiales bacterium]
MRRKNAAAKVAFPAVLGALAVILVYLACIAPTGRWGIVAAAGLLPAAAVVSVGLKAGFLCWAGASILALLLAPDKLCALLFAVLFGLYPMVKSLAEGLRKKPVEYLLKLAFFNAAFTALYLTMMGAVLASLPPALGGAVWLLYLAANLVFLAYDYGFSRLIAVYIARVQRAVH